MPEHAQTTGFFMPLIKRFYSPVDSDKLVILGYDLGFIFVKKNEVLKIIEQAIFGAQTMQQTLKAGTFGFDGFGVDGLFFVVGPQPFKEMLPLSREAANFSFEGVGQDTEGIAGKELGDILLVVDQVFIKGLPEFDVGILQFFEFEPLEAREPLALFYSSAKRRGFQGSGILDEEEVDVLVDDGGAFLMGSNERVVDFRHELDDFQLFRGQSGFFADLAEGRVFRGFLAFHVSFR